MMPTAAAPRSRALDLVEARHRRRRRTRLHPGAVFAGLLCWAAFVAPASGQGIGLAALAGTTGVGPEVSFRTGSVVIRGAYGRLPVTIDATRWFDFEGVERVGVELPRNWFTVGADLALGRVFRVGGGVLYKPDDFKADVTLGADTVAIGGRSYSLADIATLEGGWSNRTAAPFVLVGFGSQASAGFGVSVDVGVAFAGDAALNLSAQGHAAVIDTDEFREALDRAERQVEDLTGRYLKYWPVVNVRLRFGVG